MRQIRYDPAADSDISANVRFFGIESYNDNLMISYTI